ncbi:MAG: efflux RND transporter periplasmic adaptor subunit [Fimbriimonadales bacterium]|nr:efflux RND transporter periplasmic adaptor subunit [Fimbriimonadales bacterium]
MKAEQTTPTPRKGGQIATVLVIVALGAGVLWLLNRPAPEETTAAETPTTLPETITLSSESLQLAQLETAPLQPQSLTRTLTLFGQIEPVPENLVNLNSRVTGRVLEIRAHVGDTVKRGQVLAVLDSEEIHRAEVAYAQARRELAFARAELERRKRLAQLGAYSSPALEEARTRLTQARAELQTAETDARNAQNAVQSAQANLSKAQTALQQARAQLARAERLLQAQLIAQQEYEALRAQHDIAQAEVETAQAQLDSARAALQAAQTRLQTAREQFQIAQQQAERAEQVFKGQYLTTKEVAEAEAAYRQAQLAVEAALDELRLLGGKPDGGHQLVITAPFDGRIASLEVTVGETVTPDKPMFRILNTRAVWASFDLYPEDVPSVRVGQPLRFTADSVPGIAFEATVQLIMPEADPNKRVVRARCVVNNPDPRLKPGLFLRAELPIVLERNALIVPAEAVQRIEGEPYLFVATGREGEFALRKVELGQTVNNQVVIRSGVKAGERVVIRNASLITGMLFGGGEE